MNLHAGECQHVQKRLQMIVSNGTSMHLIMASPVLRTFLAKNVHLSKHVLSFHLPKFGTMLFHVRHSACHSMSSLMIQSPQPPSIYKLMRIIQVNPGFFKTVTTRQGFPMCRWHRSYLHALACPLTAIFAIRSEYCGNLHINEMASRPSLH